MAAYYSSSTPYANSDDLKARIDVRVLCQLASDTDVPINASDLSSNTRVSACLLDASGMVEAACAAGQRYLITGSQNDLANLTGASQSLLKWLVCYLAFEMLMHARPMPDMEFSKQFEKVQEMLDRLTAGDWVFGVIDAEQAGNLNYTLTTDDELNNLPATTRIASRIFGERGSRQWLNNK